ncbi:Dolichyl-phosphate-mannose-protein mannosyltransferase [Nocardioides scoriae]|uniref:Dolichyl-phosphate-mannose-protein mannosyltransferase n=1 Tax=Nocardioides scoriae TaxID=642780 RepID=A0A1H1PAZ6_9ACTN|nr:glycosyltransferase family 39 protein [Nocardioides scoriae]SDS08421.1 Dolichyl-phosphate-mannose-protein mannosyltransferase [Nocardioides scoriae]
MTTTELGRDVGGRREVRPVAWRSILLPTVVVALALTLSSGAYGYHRDELYFRMLPARWGYVDQPPLTPFIARTMAGLVDQVWAMHLPATLLMAGSVVVMALLARELGGDRSAQTLCAWAYGTALLPLEFSRVLLTATVDLVLWPLIVLLVVRAVVREEPRWWLLAGLVVGLSTYNKLLVAVLVVGVVAGIALVGPRRLLRSPWPWGAGLVALVVGAPNLVYQATHDWPQLTMGQALADANGTEVRLVTLPLLLVMLGLPLVPVWGAGLVALWRGSIHPELRFLAAALPVVVALTLLGGSQPYYPLGLLSVVLAAGCVVVARQRWVVPAVVANATVSVLVALPVVPLAWLSATPITTFNQVGQDQIGWPAHVARVAEVRDALPPAQRRRSVVVADNYGEAGALARYGPDHGITQVYSAHNELYYLGRPPESATVAVVVGTSPSRLRGWFASCRIVAQLDNGLGIGNQEQDQPITVCRNPLGGWATVWPQMQHHA